MGDLEWVLLAYRLPREPSTPRIALWRKLRRLGAVQVIDGLAALPDDPSTAEAFDWLADEVIEAGGEAWTWRAKPGSKQQQQALRLLVNEAVAEEYHSLVAEAETAAPSRRTLARLRRQLRDVQARDRFSIKEGEQARRAVERLDRSIRSADREAAR